MSINAIVRDRPVLILYSLMITSLAELTFLRPLLQDQNYHEFADQRALFGSLISGTLFQICLSLPSEWPACCGFVTIPQPWCSFQGYY
jgi:hypothetical protein